MTPPNPQNQPRQDSKASGESAHIVQAGLVVIGKEILNGRTPDCNTTWIAEQLGHKGIDLYEVRIVGDRREQIAGAVRDLQGECDYVLTTGGIGPTHDDITTESIAHLLGRELVTYPEAMEALEMHYGVGRLNAARMKMSKFPEGARLIPNPVSAAPGFIIENVYVMAGVPRIMHAMLDHAIKDMKTGTPIFSKTISCVLSESALADKLAELQKQFPNVDIGSYPQFRGGMFSLALVLRCANQDLLYEATEEVIGLIETMGDHPRAISILSKELAAK